MQLIVFILFNISMVLISENDDKIAIKIRRNKISNEISDWIMFLVNVYNSFMCHFACILVFLQIPHFLKQFDVAIIALQ